MNNVVKIEKSPVLTPKQEAAVQAFLFHEDNAIRGNKSGAYRHAYTTSGMKDESIWVEACALFAHPYVSQRVKELRREMQKGITIEDLIAELEDAQALADSAGQAGARVSASMGKAKLLGFITEKVQQDTTIRDHRDAKPVQFSEALAKAKA